MKWNKNEIVLAETYTKIPSSLSGEDVYDKKGNKIQALYWKNDLMFLVKNYMIKMDLN